MKAQTIVTEALREIGAIAAIEQPSASQAAVGLVRLQGLVDSWAADEFANPFLTRLQHTLAAGTQEYTIGAEGEFDTARPVWIVGVNVVTPQSDPIEETPLSRLDDDGYANTPIKATTGAILTAFYYNGTVPRGTLFFYPNLTVANDVVIYVLTSLAVPTSLSDDLVGPPGYQDALIYELALRLCTPFARQVPALLPGMAERSYARMKQPHLTPLERSSEQGKRPTLAQPQPTPSGAR